MLRILAKPVLRCAFYGSVLLLVQHSDPRTDVLGGCLEACSVLVTVSTEASFVSANTFH